MTEPERALLEEKFIGVHARMDANSELSDSQHVHINDTLIRIEKQTLLTNGRVSFLERDKWKRTGVTIALSLIIPIITVIVLLSQL